MLAETYDCWQLNTAMILVIVTTYTTRNMRWYQWYVYSATVIYQSNKCMKPHVDWMNSEQGNKSFNAVYCMLCPQACYNCTPDNLIRTYRLSTSHAALCQIMHRLLHICTDIHNLRIHWQCVYRMHAYDGLCLFATYIYIYIYSSELSFERAMYVYDLAIEEHLGSMTVVTFRRIPAILYMLNSLIDCNTMISSVERFEVIREHVRTNAPRSVEIIMITHRTVPI